MSPPVAGFKQLKTEKEARAYFDQEFKAKNEPKNDWVVGSKNLSDRERQALAYYAGIGSDVINDSLRNGDPPEEDAKILDGAIKRNKTSEPLIVYRGVESSALLKKLKAGKIFTDKGFVSTTLDPDTADNFARNRGFYKHIIFEIELPKGTNVGPGSHTESELILARGSKFKIRSIEKRKAKRNVGAAMQSLMNIEYHVVRLKHLR